MGGGSCFPRNHSGGYPVPPLAPGRSDFEL